METAFDNELYQLKISPSSANAVKNNLFNNYECIELLFQI